MYTMSTISIFFLNRHKKHFIIEGLTRRAHSCKVWTIMSTYAFCNGKDIYACCLEYHSISILKT